MNQEELKALLLKVRPAPKEFPLIYSGKKSKTANGMYFPETAEIIIHNKNAWTDSQLIKTGLHEYAHHLQFCQDGKTNHARAFQAILADLTTEAMSQGLYSPDYSGIKEYCTKIRTALATIAQMEKSLGDVLNEFQIECTRQGLDFYEVADRELKLTRRSIKRYDSARQLEMFPEDIEVTPDLVSAVASASQKDKKETIEKIIGGVTASQAVMPKPSKPAESDDTTPQLIKEKKRLEKTMHKLADRLEQIDETLSARLEQESEPHGVITNMGGDGLLRQAICTHRYDKEGKLHFREVTKDAEGNDVFTLLGEDAPKGESGEYLPDPEVPPGIYAPEGAGAPAILGAG